MVRELILIELAALELEVERLIKKYHHHYPRDARKTLFTIFINNSKIQFTMAKLSVVSGTKVAGSAAPKAADGTILPISAFLPGSCKFSVNDGAGFSIAPTDDEEDFAVTETTPGTASTGTISFDAQDINGTQLPTASFDLEFTVAPPPPPPLAVGSQIIANGQVVA